MDDRAELPTTLSAILAVNLRRPLLFLPNGDTETVGDVIDRLDPSKQQALLARRDTPSPIWTLLPNVVQAATNRSGIAMHDSC